MANDEDLEYPRWEHHADYQSELVYDADGRAALFERWANGHGVPKGAQARTITVPPRPIPPAAKPLVTAAPPPPPPAQFLVYDINTDEDVPLTQDRLDALLLAEQAMGRLWPAIRRDIDGRVAESHVLPIGYFPPETTAAIDDVEDLLGLADGDDATEAAGDALERAIETGDTDAIMHAADDVARTVSNAEPVRRRPGRPAKPKPEA